MNADVLLSEIENLVRNEPGFERYEYFDADVIGWFSRVKAVAEALQMPFKLTCDWPWP